MNATAEARRTQRGEGLKGNLTEECIGAAIEVHRALGPGLLKSSYEECLCRELSLRNIPFGGVNVKGTCIKCGQASPSEAWFAKAY